jgi:hypothetical protein
VLRRQQLLVTDSLQRSLHSYINFHVTLIESTKFIYFYVNHKSSLPNKTY